MTPDDHEVLKNFQDGDESAFNIIVQRYQERIYWTAKRFLNDHDEADDIVQEVFVKAYSAFKNFRGDSGVYTWLYRITVNLSLNALRRQKVRDFLRLDELLAPHDSETPTPVEAMEQEETQKLIEQAIMQLPEKQKAVFVLRYHEEMPYEQISKILKTSIGGLKANYFHAVKKIGAFIKKAHGTR